MSSRSAAGIIAMFFAFTPVIAAAAAPPAGAPLADDQHPAATLTVTGHGQISRAPDLATVSVTIVTHDDAAARALSDNNRRFAALSTKLTANGIAPGDIISTSISSYFNPHPPAASPNVGGQLFGFVVTRNVQINVNALAATGEVVDVATTTGATQINGVSFGFRDRRSVEREALAAAVSDAYAQAQTLAGAAHVAIVRVLRIGDDTGSPGRIVAQPMMLSRISQDAVPTTVAPSDLDVASSVSITYAIR